MEVGGGDVDYSTMIKVLDRGLVRRDEKVNKELINEFWVVLVEKAKK